MRRATMAALLAAALMTGSGSTVAQTTSAAPPAQTAPSPSELFPTDPLAFAIAVRLASDDSLLLDTSVNAGSVDEPILGVLDFYEARRFQPLWLTNSGLNPFGETLLARLADVDAHALNPDDYRADVLAKLAATATGVEDLARLDVDLSKTFIQYASHLAAGRVRPHEVNKALHIFPEIPPPGALLATVEEVENFDSFLEGLAPNTPNYTRLKARLADYRAKAAAGGFTPVPAGEVLKPGMTDPRLGTLRKRLAEEDLLTPESHSGDVYDGALIEAVKRFQEYHGLEPDGVIGKNTLEELNVPIEVRIEQMALNMERRRWMPDDLGERYVFVNLADQNLKVVENDRTVHTTRVVVGKPYHATPVFSDTITYAEVNPYWTVPVSIATKEYLPQLKRNPAALSGKGMRVFSGNNEVSPTAINWNAYGPGNFPFTLRQDPGDGNALGRIKFMFPNPFNIYIHDTPSKSLFSRAQRDFSHGCIRAENPFELGAVLLQRDGWTLEALQQARAEGQRRVIKLKEPIPVHLTYLTAWVNKDGSTHFRRDIYGRDATLRKALANAGASRI